MELGSGMRTDVGLHRELNEDSVLADSPVFAVADGMGGHAAGEVASAIAVERFRQFAGRDDIRPEDVLAAMSEANSLIVERESSVPETSGMGTTLAGLCLGTVGGTPHWFVVNVGDSRVYRLADSVLTQISVDHSEVAELVAAGEITADEATTHPRRNVITRSLGTEPAPVPDIWVLPVVEGERFLICSDGLTLELDEAEIARVLGDAADPQTAADRLVRRAVDAGGRDNVSAVVVEVPRSFAPQPIDVSTAPRSSLADEG